MYMIEINSSMLSGTDKYVRMQLTNVDGTAQDGAVMCILSGPRYERGIQLGALT